MKSTSFQHKLQNVEDRGERILNFFFFFAELSKIYLILADRAVIQIEADIITIQRDSCQTLGRAMPSASLLQVC